MTKPNKTKKENVNETVKHIKQTKHTLKHKVESNN